MFLLAIMLLALGLTYEVAILVFGVFCGVSVEYFDGRDLRQERSCEFDLLCSFCLSVFGKADEFTDWSKSALQQCVG